MNPTYVTFAQAKLLKEKRFDENCRMLINGAYEPYHLNLTETILQRNSEILESCYSIPEQWQVVEWLRVKHGIWINVEPCMGIQSDWRTLIEGTFSFMYAIRYANEKLYLENHNKSMIFEKGFKTPQEAYSAAFDYVLTKLI